MRWPTCAAAVALLLLARAAVAADPTAPASTRWIEAEQITHSRTNCGSSTIAVDGTGTTDIVYPDHEPGHADIFAVTRASSGERTTPVNLSNTPGSSNFPAAARSATGALHVVWQDDTPGNSQVYYAWRPPDGPWSTPENISTSTGYADRPRIALDRAGAVHVAWDDATSGNWEIRYRARGPDGRWNATRNISQTPGPIDNEDCPPALALGPDGFARVVWFDRSGPWAWDIHFARQTAAGSWTPSARITTGGHAFYPSLAVDAAGRAHVAWSAPGTPSTGQIFYVEETR